MNYTLQLHGERVVYAVPPGLYELMSDVAREVLRDQPSMLYQYIAHYLDTLVRVRGVARTAAQLVDSVAQDGLQLVTYAESLGLNYEQADRAARRIQRAFRAYRSRHDVRRQVMRRLEEMEATGSFRQLLETYSLDEETATRASEVIQRAYREYCSKKMLEERRTTRDASTHTVETIVPKTYKPKSVSQEEKPPKRVSKPLVYQQSPRGSVLSSWSTLARDLAEEERKLKSSWTSSQSPELVYEQTDSMLLSSRKKPVSEILVAPREMKALPSYYDKSQPKIPMISESGLLVADDSIDVVTLFSTDSDDHTRFTSANSIHLPSISSLATSKPEDLAKELFDIIDNKTHSSSKSPLIKTPSKASRRVSQEFLNTLNDSNPVKELSSASVARNISTERTSSKHISIVEGTESKVGSSRKSRKSLKSISKTKGNEKD